MRRERAIAHEAASIHLYTSASEDGRPFSNRVLASGMQKVVDGAMLIQLLTQHGKNPIHNDPVPDTPKSVGEFHCRYRYGV